MATNYAARIVASGNATHGAGGFNLGQFDVSRLDEITILVRLKGTVTIGDLAFLGVSPVDSAGVSFFRSLTPVRVGAVITVGADVLAHYTFDVTGLLRVAITGTNNNAADLAIDVDMFGKGAT